VALFAIARMSVPQSEGLVEPLWIIVHVAPPSVERDHPVKCDPEANEPESLKPATIVLPKATIVVSLWVKREVPVDPVLLLIKGLLVGDAGIGPL
jgi:hypothetical protein